MMKKILDDFVDKLDEHIKLYSQNYLKEIKEYNSKSGNEAYVCNERLLATESNNFIKKYINDNGVNVLVSCSEFPIHINKANKNNLDDLKKEVSYNKVTSKWDTCFVDGYFKYISNGENKHAFVEYKLQNKFIYGDLATDFLKYKLYTQNFNANSLFCYIIFKKEENYPSILGKEKSCYLEKNIDSSGIFDSNVYLYNGNSSEIKKENIEILPELVTKMNRFSKYSSELTELQNIQIEEIDDKKKVYLDLLPKFNSRVIKSSLINENYDFIHDLWVKANEIGIFEEIINGEELDDILLLSDLLKWAAQKYNVIDSQISDADRFSAEQTGVRGSSYASLNLLAMLDYFGDVFNIPSKKPDYKQKSIGKGANKKVLHYKETADKRKEKLKSKFSEKSELLKLCYVLLIYLIQVYNILYEIDPNTHQIKEEKNISKLLKLEEELQEIYNKVIKLLGFKKKIKIKDIKDEYPLRDLFNFIYEIYK